MPVDAAAISKGCEEVYPVLAIKRRRWIETAAVPGTWASNLLVFVPQRSGTNTGDYSGHHSVLLIPCSCLFLQHILLLSWATGLIESAAGMDDDDDDFTPFASSAPPPRSCRIEVEITGGGCVGGTQHWRASHA